MTPSPPDRRTVRTVLLVSAILLLSLAVVEVGGRLAVERSAASALRGQGVSGATVTVGRSRWRPMLLPAVLGGSVDRVRVELRDADVSGVEVGRVDYVLDDLEVDPNPFRGTLGVSGIGSGSFRLLVAPESVGDALGVPARVLDGRLVVGPDDEPAKLRTDRNGLVIESPYLRREGIDSRLNLIDVRLLPCEPEAEVVGPGVELRCSGSRLPAILDEPLGEPVGPVPAPTELEPPVTAERGAGATATTVPGAPPTVGD